MQATNPILEEQSLQQAAGPSSTAALVPTDRAVTGPARSLLEIEDFLAAMVDSAEGVSAEQMAEYLADLGAAGDVARAKRDCCAQTIFRYDDMVQLINARVAHLQERIDQMKMLTRRIAAERGRFEAYLLSLVEQYGEVPKRLKAKRLEGNVFALCVEKNPDTVNVTDEAAVPREFKRVAVTLDLPVYERLVELGFTQGYTEADMPQGTVSVMKRELKAALDGGEVVPGAEIKTGENQLVVRARKA